MQPVMDGLLNDSAAMVGEESLIAADLTDIAKYYARHLEGLGRVGHKLMRSEERCTSYRRKTGPPRLTRQAHQLVDLRRRSGRTPALPYPPPETKISLTEKSSKTTLDRRRRLRDIRCWSRSIGPRYVRSTRSWQRR